MTKVFLLSIFAIGSIFAASSASAGDVADSAVKESVGMEVVSREQLLAIADDLFQSGRQATMGNEYDKAIRHYDKALELYAKCNPESPIVRERYQRCLAEIDRNHFSWAESLIEQWQVSDDLEKYEDALKVLRRLAGRSPSAEPQVTERLRDYESLMRVRNYRRQIAIENIDPDFESRQAEIDKLMREGVVLYNDRKYDRARIHFEDILIRNPYHQGAIEYVRKINLHLSEIGGLRAATTFRERIAESEWNAVTPLMPRVEVDRGDEAFGQPMLDLVAQGEKTDDTDIHRKLRETIIPHIEFEEVTISTVVNYLKQVSKQLDPEGFGVNFFLRLPQAESAPELDAPAADAWGGAAADDDWGGGGGGWGDEQAAAPGVPALPTSDEPTVTMVVDDIPLLQAVQYICRAANLRYRIDPHVVIIASPDVAIDDVETRIYPMEREAVTEIGAEDDENATVAYFQRRGISFPQNAKVVYDERISRLIVTNTPENLQLVEEIIRELNVVDPQVLIQAKFVEIAQNDLEELGFNYRFARDGLTPRPAGEADSRIAWTAPTFDQQTLNRSIGDDRIFRLRYQGDVFGHEGFDFEMMVHALDQLDSANVLSTPRVTTLNGQEAVIRMVEERYFPGDWNQPTVGVAGAYTTFLGSSPVFGDPEELGIVLRVTPNVDADQYTINLDMLPVVKELIDWTDYSWGEGRQENRMFMPVIEARSVETSITIYDGETLVLGGIIRNRVNHINDKIPILGDIPLIGRMFQSKSTDSTKENLLIFLSCRLVNPDGTPIRERDLRGLPPFRQ